MKLGFDVPGQRGFAVLMENYIVAKGVDVLGVNEKTVHVKEACSDFGETDSSRLVWAYRKSHSHGGGEQQEYTYLFLRAAIVELVGEVKDC